jgi:hypothetical protein
MIDIFVYHDLFRQILSFTCILQIKLKVAEKPATAAPTPVVVDSESESDDLPSFDAPNDNTTPPNVTTPDVPDNDMPTIIAPVRLAKRIKLAAAKPSTSKRKDTIDELRARSEKAKELQERIRVTLQNAEESNSTRILWGNWLTSMMQSLHSSVWLAYTTASFDRILHFTRESERLYALERNTQGGHQPPPQQQQQTSVIVPPQSHQQQSFVQPQQRQQQLSQHQLSCQQQPVYQSQYTFSSDMSRPVPGTSQATTSARPFEWEATPSPAGPISTYVDLLTNISAHSDQLNLDDIGPVQTPKNRPAGGEGDNQ